MAQLKIHQGEWVVVCDGAKALLLENAGDELAPNLKTREVMHHKALATHEMGTDAPGRAFNSANSNRSAVGQTDWHAQAENEFLGSIAKKLDGELKAGHVKSIILVAPPRALGVLRQAISPALRHIIRAEIDKDLVKAPIYEIEKHLTA